MHFDNVGALVGRNGQNQSGRGRNILKFSLQYGSKMLYPTFPIMLLGSIFQFGTL